MPDDMNGRSEYFATCAKGLERLVAAELADLGIKGIRPLASGVAFQATLEQACRAVLWLRCASRVLRVVGRVAARDADQLYAGCSSIPWERFVEPSRTIAVFAKGGNDKINNSRFAALRVKDALCDRLTRVFGERPSVDTKAPDIPVRVNLHASKATIYLDLCGQPLHMRGYRPVGATVEAPLKETLACAVLRQGGWPQVARGGGCLVDPFCGSGTIAIEGACMAADIAPGILRQDWCVRNWRGFDESLLDALLDEADDRAEAGRAAAAPILAADIDPAAVEIARACARRAGVADLVRFECSDAGKLDLVGLPESGLVATNPPYGERIMSTSQLPAVMGTLRGVAFTDEHSWDICAIVADPDVDSLLGLAPKDVLETFNGPLEATIRHYGSTREGAPAPVSAKGAEEFANRLRKMAAHRGKWARKNGVTCYRVYDADLPDFAISVDLYQGAGDDSARRWAYVCEYAPPKTVDPAVAQGRVNAALDVVRNEFGLDASSVFFKRRARSKGGSQYASPEGQGASPDRMHTVFEGGHLFRVSFDARLDTGIFLDTRLVREMIQANAAGKSFLNLFAYTGTASVYAAAGGAASTTTVDMSQTYIDWARANMALNHFEGPQHTFERADAIEWISDVRHSRTRFDLVYVDPPTFSNSKRMRSGSWDVQRDHAELLIDVSRVLTDGGVAIFCCNLRGFTPDVETLAKAHVGLVDVSAKTIPADFERNAKVHHCYILRRLG